MNPRSNAWTQDVATRDRPIRQAAWLLLVSAAALALTGLLHPPSGHSLLEPGHEPGPIWYLTHLLGVGIWPLFAVGFAELAGYLAARGARLLSGIGFGVFVFAGAAAVGSGLLGGFVRPRIAATYLAASPDQRFTWASIYDYNTTVNEVFADAYQVALATAIALIGAAFLHVRTATVLAWTGLVGGALLALAFAAGVLAVHAVDFHVFVLVNLLCVAWIISLSAHLIRASPPHTPRGASR